jgi:hypothetical protein
MSQMNNTSIAGVRIPDSKLAQAATELVRDTESDLLFHHSTRVYYFGALAGLRQNLKFDSELLYIGAMFHDMGLTNAAPLSASKLTVPMPCATSCGSMASTRQPLTWSGTAIALHTTPGIPQHKKPEVALALFCTPIYLAEPSSSPRTLGMLPSFQLTNLRLRLILPALW